MMGFLSPLVFLLAIPLAGVIIALYLLKLKRKERVISSVFLWKQAIQDVQANAPFQKLKKNLLLFIQLAVIVLAVVALARPFARTTGLAGQNIVIIIDSSASMSATDSGKSRFDEARQKALAAVDRMGKGDSILVITSSAKTRVISSFTSDKKALANAISALKPCDTQANIRQAMVLALSLVAKKQNPQIIVISDGGIDSTSDLQPGNAKITFIRVGKRSDNVGIIALDARRTLAGTQQVFVGLKNFSDRKRDYILDFYLNDKLIDSRQESIDKGAAKQEILPELPQADGRLTVKLDIKDDLASDNIAHIYLTPPRRISVLLVTKGNIFLERALNVNPYSEVVKAAEAPADLSRYKICVFDGIKPPDTLPRGGYLLINTDSKAAPAQLKSSLQHPSVADWSKTHPATRFVDFSSTQIAQAKALSVTRWGQELVECEGGTIAAAGERDGRRFVMLGWDLLKSDFPLRVGFPVLIINCTEWLTGSDSSIQNLSVKAGDIIPLDPHGEKKITITDPEGQSTVIVTNGGTTHYDGAERIGVYKVKVGNKTYEFACNLLSPQESDITPKGELALGERKVKQSSEGIKTNAEYWRLFLILGLLLLSFEWYAFHRRLG